MYNNNIYSGEVYIHYLLYPLLLSIDHICNNTIITTYQRIHTDTYTHIQTLVLHTYILMYSLPLTNKHKCIKHNIHIFICSYFLKFLYYYSIRHICHHDQIHITYRRTYVSQYVM